jgi:hypothetical protein
MRAIHRGLAAFALGLVCLSQAGAATVCVPNKQTGRLEPLVAGSGSVEDCARSAARTPSQSATAGVPAAASTAPGLAGSHADARRNWVLKSNFQTLEEAIEAFAAQVDYEVIYEAREFPLELKRDMTIAANADFWEALRVLGEAYRKSDGAFQILPTRFRQIVVLPMGQEAAVGQP